ncbi:larval cuticle protein A2B-like [Leptopilina boulardi]|uniref:larval cuticle protein A2B-like n=1 Tax=Leptopilina boulardi TaxID=63433 RepID=UPI0021F69A5E|nr:larval cuticle protein A2B-like [Leptopilina boulardi]
MAFQFVVLSALIAAANAGAIGAPLAYAAPTLIAKPVDADFDPHPQYSFAYDVQDSLTGDFKSQHETRNGDMVQGSYSLLEADGTKRIVDYHADDVNGFNAIVRKEAVAKIAAPVITAAPAKIAYAPTAHYSYASPIVAAPAQLSYAQQIAKISPATAHITYAQPIAKPALTYGPPIAKIPAAPVLAATKYAGPLSYIAHVTYTSPYISYAH